MKHTYPDITSLPLRHRMAEALNNVRRRWILQCIYPDNFAAVVRRDTARLGVHEMARQEQALDNEQDARIERMKNE